MFGGLFSKKPSVFERRSTLFREIIRNYIISFQNSRYPDCEDMIMKYVNDLIQQSRDEIQNEWDDTENYQLMGLTQLYRITFDMATSGHYHIYLGILDPFGKQLENVCRKSLDSAMANGFITSEVYDDQVSALVQSIHNVG